LVFVVGCEEDGDVGVEGSFCWEVVDAGGFGLINVE